MILVYNLDCLRHILGRHTKNELRLLPEIDKIDILSSQLQYIGIFHFQFQEAVYRYAIQQTETAYVYIFQ